MTSIGPGSGQAHLLALLRAIRLRTEATAASADGAGADTTPVRAGQSGTPRGPVPPTPAVAAPRPASAAPDPGTAVQTPAGTAVQLSPGSSVTARSGSTVVVPSGGDVAVQPGSTATPATPGSPIPIGPAPQTPIGPAPIGPAPAGPAPQVPTPQVPTPQVPTAQTPTAQTPTAQTLVPRDQGGPLGPRTPAPGTAPTGGSLPPTPIHGTVPSAPPTPGAIPMPGAAHVPGTAPLPGTALVPGAAPLPGTALVPGAAHIPGAAYGPGAARQPGTPAGGPSRGPYVPGALPALPDGAVPTRPGLVVPGVTGPIHPVVPPIGRPQSGGPDVHPWPYPPSTGPGAAPHTGVPYPGAPHAGPAHPGALPGDPLLHVPPTGRPAAGASVDGPDPADDVALHHLHEVLSTSLTLAGGVDAVSGRLRDALMLAHPRLMAAVPGTEVTHQQQLAQALTWLVDNLEHPPVLAAGCGQLGAALREFGVPAQQLQLTGAALAEAMRAGMPTAWRQEYDSAWRSTWHHVHDWMIHGAEAARYTPMRWTAVVAEHDQRLSDLAVLRLRPYLPMPFQPGQYARVEVSEQPGVWRPYSLAGAPRSDNVLELHVRAKGQSGVSGALVHRTRAGDRVRLSRAEGNLVLPPEPDRDLLFIAGDTGVAPLKALLTEMARTDDPRAVVLFWGARTLGDLYDIGEVEAVASACRRATVVPVISQGRAGPYAAGLVTDAVAAYGEWSRHEVYLAGPPPMLTATRAVLRGLGLAHDRIHHDPTEVDLPAIIP